MMNSALNPKGLKDPEGGYPQNCKPASVENIQPKNLHIHFTDTFIYISWAKQHT